jgi:endonuclease/exonuclease/phosphatase family metal-dependent hydrolase
VSDGALRALVWNVRGLRAGVGAVAEVVEAHRPDVALLTEVGRFGRRLRRLERRTGMRGISGLRVLRRGIANAVLARPPWRVVRHEVIGFAASRTRIPRGAVCAVVGHAGTRLTAVALHLGLSAPERLEHARELTDRLPSLRHPVLVGGDLNEGPDGRAASWITERLWDAFAVSGEGPGDTYPAADPRARIDVLCVTDGVVVERAVVGVDAAGASDHLPLVVDLRVVAGAPSA